MENALPLAGKRRRGGDDAGLPRVKDEPRHLVAFDDGQKVAASFIIIEENVTGMRRVIEHDFRLDIHIHSAAHDDSI